MHQSHEDQMDKKDGDGQSLLSLLELCYPFLPFSFFLLYSPLLFFKFFLFSPALGTWFSGLKIQIGLLVQLS